MSGGAAAMAVTAPVSGTTVALEELTDPVFSAGLVGPGIAVEPRADAVVSALAPVTGTLVKVHPHAFVIDSGTGAVLVHMGIDTVNLAGAGFEVLAAERDEVRQGQELVRMDSGAVAAAGYALTVPVIALEAGTAALGELARGEVAAGEVLFRWG